MVLARWQATITDEAGNIVPNADIEVRREIAGQPLVPLFSDRDGLTTIGNPFTIGPDGFAAFHVAGGAYRIKASKGAFERIWPYVGIGLAKETDALTTGIAYRFDSSIVDADPGEGNLRLNNAALASVTQIFLDNQSADAADVTAWLDSLDDGGATANRGTLTLLGSDAASLLLCRVTGSVVDGTGYRKVSVTVLASSGGFTAGQTVSIQFSARGIDGEVAGPVSATDNNLPAFNGTTGKVIKDSGIPAVSAHNAARAVTEQSITTAGATLGVNMANGWHVSLSLNHDITTFNVTNPPPSGELGKITLDITSSGLFNISAWPGTTIWPGAIPPTITASGKDTIILTTTDGGTTWRGHVAGQALA